MNIDIIFSKINEEVKKQRKNKKLKRYYIEKTQNGKTLMAVLLDVFLVRILLVAFILVYIYYKTETLWFSILITIQFFMLFSIFTYKVKKIKMEKEIKEINNSIAKNKIHKEFINETPDNFILKVKDNLEKCNFNNLVEFNNSDIDLVGTFNGKKIGIKCYRYNKDYKVNITNVREFFLSLRKYDLEEGAIITTSGFSEDLKDFLPKLQNHIKIHTFDIDDYIKIMKKAQTYPTTKEIEKIIVNKITTRRRKIVEYRNKVLSKDKGRKYIVISLIIYIFANLTPYKLYYQITALILFVLGLVTILNGLYNTLKPSKEEKEEEMFESC